MGIDSRVFKKSWGFVKRVYICILMVFFSGNAHAALPTAPEISGASDGNYLKVFNVVMSDGSDTLITLLFIGAGLAAVGTIVSSLIEAKKTKEWGHFSIVLIACAIVITISIVILAKLHSSLPEGT